MAFNLDYVADNVSHINQFFSGHYWSCLDMNNDYDLSRATMDTSHRMQAGHQRRRKRTTFSKAQLGQLERAFSQNQYPDCQVKRSLSSLTGLPESKIQVWFQNRRARYFKSKKTTSAAMKSAPDRFQSRHPHTPPPPAAMCGTSLLHPSPYPSPYPSPAAHGLTPSRMLSPGLPESAKLSRAQDAAAGRALFRVGGGWAENPEFTGPLGGTDVFPCDPASDGLFSLAFLGDARRGSRPAGSRCGTGSGSVQTGTSGSDGYEDVLLAGIGCETPDDLSEVSFQNIGECNLSDLDISEAMIDYLLG
ncbi:unnamed protein product [Merluccius merluccius]